MIIHDLHTKLINDYWNYICEYTNHNGYRKVKELTPEIKKKLTKLEDTIKKLKEL